MRDGLPVVSLRRRGVRGRQGARCPAHRVRRAEASFAADDSIISNKKTKPETFNAFLVDARRNGLKCIPESCTEDEDLVNQMVLAEEKLLGPDRCNRAVMECIRWVVLERPRPQ